MNPRKYRHLANVIREREVVDLEAMETQPACPQQVATGLKCLIEGKGSQGRSSMVGRVGQGIYKMTWTGPKLVDNDLVKWTDGPGATQETYYVSEVQDDTYRGPKPYWTCDLKAKK